MNTKHFYLFLGTVLVSAMVIGIAIVVTRGRRLSVADAEAGVKRESPVSGGQELYLNENFSDMGGPFEYQDPVPGEDMISEQMEH